MLDAARHELDGRTDQRDIILASIIPIIIRNRINEPASEKVTPPGQEEGAVKKITPIPAAIETAETLPAATIAEPEAPPPGRAGTAREALRTQWYLPGRFPPGGRNLHR